MAKNGPTNKKDRPAKKPNGKGDDPLLKEFDLHAAELPDTIADRALTSGGFPYDEKLRRSQYEDELKILQTELVKLQLDILRTGQRVVILFEGRDTAGKGGTIKRFTQYLNPRQAKVVALDKPTDTERGSWYFQRYLGHLPPRGNMALFDRSWYNRAGVETVMGYCTEDERADFLREAPQFEGMLVRDGFRFFKLYLTIGREMQLKRFHQRRHDPLKIWKLSPNDVAAIEKWDDYTSAQDDMFRFTHTETAPWTVVRANDQRRGRLEAIRYVLTHFEYEGKDDEAIGEVDPLIVGSGPDFFHSEPTD
ncbi:MAG: polyphosphate kinase 2 [Pseudomonadota bacterium]